jgi:hypothetical protein
VQQCQNALEDISARDVVGYLVMTERRNEIADRHARSSVQRLTGPDPFLWSLGKTLEEK